VVGPGEVAYRRGVGLPGGEPDLPGPQHLSPAEHRGVGAGALRQLLDQIPLVAAPGDVHTPHLALAETEPGHAHRHEVRRVKAGLAPAHLPGVGAVGQRAALGRALPAPLAGEVQDLPGPAGQRKQGGDLREVVGRRVGVLLPGDPGLHAQHSGGLQPVGDGGVESGSGVGEPQGQFAALGLGAVGGFGEAQPGRGGGAGQVALVGRGAGPAVRLRGPDGEASWDVDGVVEHGGLVGQREGSQSVLGQLAQVGPPVQDSWHRLGELHDE
jgi:hypothetical protein